MVQQCSMPEMSFSESEAEMFTTTSVLSQDLELGSALVVGPVVSIEKDLESEPVLPAVSLALDSTVQVFCPSVVQY